MISGFHKTKFYDFSIGGDSENIKLYSNTHRPDIYIIIVGGAQKKLIKMFVILFSKYYIQRITLLSTKASYLHYETNFPWVIWGEH